MARGPPFCRSSAGPEQALIIFVLPMPIMLLGLLDNTCQQHQGLDMSHDHTACRNTTSKLYNLISRNPGYHTAHHMHPGLGAAIMAMSKG